MTLSMTIELQSWSKQKSKRETHMQAMTERLRLPKLPANAVMLKPRGRSALNPTKLFKDEEDFLEIESSLATSESDDSKEMMPKLTGLQRSATLDALPELKP
eukprot:CAMPEP_0185599476 /NCGR_PEP_ID=MMETSP0434-20130131/82729_1 /TAXON_ID=626734 ORGANISM="Favella taraikaensis, Strain Fe Narragansett Bay" /NCGR_SAMPLE_ID=MMETSP0434 /ASSEMBLY_ACC=CAM_ASM_000379 /LENGTH=101 /DNA_ID=CAMNT_0028228887 /DNA_START=793 /DNA_END=1098 /DNA_ORIENTATION=-